MRSERVLIEEGEIITKDSILSQTDILIEDGIISQIGKKLGDRFSNKVEKIYAKGWFVAPGLIDIHFNGAGGFTFEDATPKSIKRISELQARYGVTAYCPTINSLPHRMLIKSIENLLQATQEDLSCQILGIHLEGPYINPNRKGVHNPSYLRSPDLRELDEYLKRSRGLLRIVTLAPELEGAKKLIRFLKENGVVPSAGHSEADFSSIKEATKTGLSHITHLFNAMRAISHRDEGILEAALVLDELSCELICDGIHIHKPHVEIALRCKKEDKICLVSDALLLGAKDGIYNFASFGSVILEDKRVYDLSEKRLAGGASPLLEGIKNLMKWFGMEPWEAFRRGSFNPAKLLGVEKEFGSIEIGKRADLILLDKGFNPILTILKGKVSFREGQWK
jgi:N-acetylglucosamine-6-phosphate deacetylase